MKLQTLEIHGFKSFAEKTQLSFRQGVTAIVGPNGCGKSNVVDAVKWVLGEQSVRSLRGREMTDVIFNGSERRPAMNMAEVTLVFDNEDRALPLDMPEVSVTRRLFRSGESEYQINRKTCRLKDVRELFMGTGLGPGGYSFMEQGKIDSVLASNPVERRKVFEEAAGISRFRARRHEAELKLDKVDANLLRLADIVDELERRERSLKIQAGKAQRYREYSQRASELQSQVALHRYHANQLRETSLAESLAEQGQARDAQQEARDERRLRHEELGVELAARNEELTQARERAADLGARESAAREMSTFHRRRLEELEGRSENRQDEIGQLESELEAGAVERERAAEEHAELAQQVEAMRGGLGEGEAAVTALRSQTQGAESELEDVASSLRELSERRRGIETEAARLEASETRWRDEIRRAEEEGANLAREQEQVKRALEEESGRGKLAAEEHERRREEVVEAESKLETLENDLAGAAETHRDLAAKRSSCNARLQAIEGVLARGEGLAEGVRRILEERERRPDFLPGCRGLMLDQVQADRELADAVEAALGDAAQALIVETLDEALEGVKFLEEAGGGRAAFVPRELFREAALGALPPGVEARDDDARRLLATLLSGVRVVPADELAETLRRGDVPPVVVTPRGDLVRDGRLLIVGGGADGVGLLAARSERDELVEERRELDAFCEEAETRLREFREARPAAIEALKAARRAQSEADARLKTLEAERRDLERQAERLASRGGESEQRLQKARGELEAIGNQGRDFGAELQELMAAIASAEGDHHARREGRSALADELEQASRELERRRIELAGAEQRLNLLANTQRHLAEREERNRAIITRFRDELDGFAGDREVSGHAAREAEAKAAELAEEVAAQRETVTKQEERVAEIRERHEALGREIREIERELESVSEAFHKLDMQLAEVRVAQEGLVARVREELELDLVVLHEDYVEDSEIDWEATETELEELRDKIRRLGNVNLAAIEDLDEVQERLEFLIAQRDDLTQSKNQLGRILGNIEEESTRLFVQTFDNVREVFQVTFRKLFGGGKADIRLADPENVLESGIDITARPPGKEARSIELLSGGERTMTAVALLFSIIKAHPCPCCLLDEVDAALDEDNTERFGMLLDEFIDRTQFILITHSRRTMARADVLFGVTMGERGVSRPVGVRFEDVGDDGEIKAGRGQALPKPRDGGPSGSGRGENGNGNGKGKSQAALEASGEQVVAGEVLLDVEDAAHPEEDGGQAKRLAEPAAPERGEEAGA
jgi:chromosome segregation protein